MTARQSIVHLSPSQLFSLAPCAMRVLLSERGLARSGATFPSCNKLVEIIFQGRTNLPSDPYIRVSRNQMLDKKTRYKLHTLIQNTKMRQTFIVLASIICTINSFKLGERGTRGAMIGLDKYQCDMLGITHINYSWGNFQFETLTQIFLQPIIAGLAMEAIKAKTHTVPGASWLFLVRYFFLPEYFFS